jgi:hypothetical protein
MLFGLDTDPYSYDDIIDNPWQFKTMNMEKENKYIQFSTFSIGSRVCEIVLKSCPLIQMTRPSDGINFTQSMNLFTYTGVLTFFVGTHEHFAWICSGPWCSRTIVQTQCRQFICHSLMTCSTYSRRAMTGGRQYSLVCTSMVMSRVGRLHSWSTTSASDVVVDMIPDRETEVNHSYSPQLKKPYFIHILLAVQVQNWGTSTWRSRASIATSIWCQMGDPTLIQVHVTTWRTRTLSGSVRKFTRWERQLDAVQCLPRRLAFGVLCVFQSVSF